MVSNTEILLDPRAYFTHRYDAANEIVTRLSSAAPKDIVAILGPLAAQLEAEVDSAFASDHRNDRAFFIQDLYDQVNGFLQPALNAIQGPAE